MYLMYIWAIKNIFKPRVMFYGLLNSTGSNDLIRLNFNSVGELKFLVRNLQFKYVLMNIVYYT